MWWFSILFIFLFNSFQKTFLLLLNQQVLCSDANRCSFWWKFCNLNQPTNKISVRTFFWFNIIDEKVLALLRWWTWWFDWNSDESCHLRSVMVENIHSFIYVYFSLINNIFFKIDSYENSNSRSDFIYVLYILANR